MTVVGSNEHLPVDAGIYQLRYCRVTGTWCIISPTKTIIYQSADRSQAIQALRQMSSYNWEFAPYIRLPKEH